MSTSADAEKVLVTFIKTLANNVLDKKIEPCRVGENTKTPYMIYVQTGRTPFGRTIDPNCNIGDVPHIYTYTVHLIDMTESGVNDLAAMLELALQKPYTGLVGSYSVQLMRIDDVYHDPEDSLRASDTWPYHKSVILTFIV